MFRSRSSGVSLLGAAALAVVCATAWAQEPMKVGEHYPIHVDSRGSSDVEGMSTATGQVFEISHPGATFMGVHFARCDLAPGDFVMVSDASGGQSYTLEGKGKMDAGTFWSQHVKGDTIVLEYVTTGENPNKGFVINKYGAGFVNLDPWFERICGDSDFENAICRSGTTEYDKARAVARLLIQNMWLCTGWLASDNDHLITNEHCISSQVAATDTDYEFMAEAPNCNDPNCQLCYTGDIYSGAFFIKDNAALDYALVQVYSTNGSPSVDYGYLEIDNRDAIVGEEMYQPAHPAGRAKEFGWYCDMNTPYPSGRCRVVSVTEPGCSSASYNDVGYWADTEGGSSGSPVLAVSSHKVIALHHCHNYCDIGGDPNRGVPIDLICPEIQDYIPSCGAGCTTHADCNDSNECTEDLCVDSVCQNNPYPDETPCTGGVCCGGACTVPACSVNADCDDAEGCTTDTCVSGGTCSAYCENTWPACDLVTPDGCCGPACNASNDADCACLPKKAPCTSDSECCSGICHPRQHWCK